jgi:hypothetical protein
VNFENPSKFRSPCILPPVQELHEDGDGPGGLQHRDELVDGLCHGLVPTLWVPHRQDHLYVGQQIALQKNYYTVLDCMKEHCHEFSILGVFSRQNVPMSFVTIQYSILYSISNMNSIIRRVSPHHRETASKLNFSNRESGSLELRRNV